MLQEVPRTGSDLEPGRRWFTDEYFDLIVWLSPPATIVTFELCYDRPGAERAVVWSSDRGYRHFRVDAGEDTPMRNLAPILVAGGSFPKAEILARFTQASGTLDPVIRTAVLQRLQACPV